jgi:hypothetical protein
MMRNDNSKHNLDYSDRLNEFQNNPIFLPPISHNVGLYRTFGRLLEPVGFQQPPKCGGEKPHKGA